jgi:hypothetical protein
MDQLVRYATQDAIRIMSATRLLTLNAIGPRFHASPRKAGRGGGLTGRAAQFAE